LAEQEVETTVQDAPQDETTVQDAPSTGSDAGAAQDDPRFDVADDSDDAGLSPDELRSKYLGARRGYSKTTQELQEAKRQLDLIKQQHDQLLDGVRNPEFVATLHSHYQRSGVAQPTAAPTPEDLAKETGFDFSTLEGLDKYLAKRGYVRKDDPELMESKAALRSLVSAKVEDTWSGLVSKYPDAGQHRGRVQEIASRVGDAMTLEQIYLGLSNGKAVEDRVKRDLKTDVAKRKEAVLPRSNAAGITQKKSPEKFDDIWEAWKAAKKEQGITTLPSNRRL
jgi:hypothetical protein